MEILFQPSDLQEAPPSIHCKLSLNTSKKILVIDIGGSNVKILATGIKNRIKIPSGSKMTPEKMVVAVKEEAADWDYDVISMAYPGAVIEGKIAKEPHNLGSGWTDFNFEKAFEKPVRILNDAATQALGSYEGGSMLFLGLGTGLGAALVKEGTIIPLEIAHLPYRKDKSYEDYVGKKGYEHLGEDKWQKHVKRIIKLLGDAFVAQDIVLGGGNAELIKNLPKHVRLGSNANAFKGGFRLWDD